MRGFGRVMGACWRLMWWVLFPPIGWYMSRQARNRRRHNQLVREIRQGPPAYTTAPPGQVPPPGFIPPPPGIKPLRPRGY